MNTPSLIPALCLVTTAGTKQNKKNDKQKTNTKKREKTPSKKTTTTKTIRNDLLLKPSCH